MRPRSMACGRQKNTDPSLKHSLNTLVGQIHRSRKHPGWVAQWVRALSHYTKVEGSVPRQGTHKKQPMNKWNNKLMSLSLSLKLINTNLKGG